MHQTEENMESRSIRKWHSCNSTCRYICSCNFSCRYRYVCIESCNWNSFVLCLA